MRASLLPLLVLTLPAAADDLPSGRFVAAQPHTEVQSVLDAALERSLDGFSWVLRGMARPRLETLVTACPAYAIAVAGETFEVMCEGRRAFRWTIGHTGAWLNEENGQTYTVSLQRRGSALALEFDGEDGGKRFVYDFAATTGLAVTQEVYSPRLPTPLRWTLAYRGE